MANSDKNIVITPNKGSSTDNPKIAFTGADSSSSNTITARMYNTSNGTLSFEGSAGQLFSITNDLTGTIFSVNDISGIPSIAVDGNGIINLAQYGGNIRIGNVSTDGTSVLEVNGNVNVTNYFTTSGMNLVSQAIQAANLVAVYMNNSLLIANANINFVNTSTINVTATASGTNKIANISFVANNAAIAASGAQGAQGFTGSQGMQGITGSQGMQGITGSQGMQGTTGSQGMQGITGSQGMQGTTGSQGMQGIQGSVGWLSTSATYASQSTLSWDSSQYNFYAITGQSGNLYINPDSATSPINGQKNMFRIKTSGVGIQGTFGMQQTTGSNLFRLIGVSIPSSLTGGNVLYIGCVYNATENKWDVIAVREGA